MRAAAAVVMLLSIAARSSAAQLAADSVRIDPGLSAELRRGSPPRVIRLAAGGGYTEGHLLRVEPSLLIYQRTEGLPITSSVFPDTIWTRESNRLQGAIGGAILGAALFAIVGEATGDAGPASAGRVCNQQVGPYGPYLRCSTYGRSSRTGSIVGGAVFGALTGALLGGALGSITSHWHFRRAWR